METLVSFYDAPVKWGRRPRLSMWNRVLSVHLSRDPTCFRPVRDRVAAGPPEFTLEVTESIRLSLWPLSLRLSAHPGLW